MALKDRKHPALIIMTEMEQTVPGQQTLERFLERKGTHVSNLPGPHRKALAAEGYQRWRGINAIYREALLDEIVRYRLTGAAANIEDGPTLREKRTESIEPRIFVSVDARAIGDIVMGMALIQSNDLVRVRIHGIEFY